MKAVASGQVQCVDMLLQKGADVNHANQQGETALMIAAEIGNAAVLGLLLNALVKRARDMEMAVQLTGKLKLTDNDRETDDKTDEDENTANCETQPGGRDQCVDLLPKSGSADVNGADKMGETALRKAVENGRHQCVELLLRAGADVNQADNDGVTVLMRAAARGERSTVENLITSGASVNQQANDGSTALVEAAKSNDSACVGLLLKNVADVGDLAKQGIWRRCQQEKCVKLLVEAGAWVEEFMVVSCRDKHSTSLAELLASAGAKEVFCQGDGNVAEYKIEDLESDRSLQNNCRLVIREHLLHVQLYKVNLLVTVPELGLPTAMKKYLLQMPVHYVVERSAHDSWDLWDSDDDFDTDNLD